MKYYALRISIAYVTVRIHDTDNINTILNAPAGPKFVKFDARSADNTWRTVYVNIDQLLSVEEVDEPRENFTANVTDIKNVRSHGDNPRRRPIVTKKGPF